MKATLILVLSLLGACGNGDGDGVSRNVLRATSTGTLDGWVRSDGELDIRGGEPGAGDLPDAKEVRTFFSFNTMDLPPDATIERATLHFRQVFLRGFVLTFNPLLIEHVDYGDSLDPTDFALLPLAAPAPFQLNELNLVRDIDVTLLVQQDVLAGRKRTQFRLRMTAGTNGVGISDFVAIETGDNEYGTGNRPELEIEFTRP